MIEKMIAESERREEAYFDIREYIRMRASIDFLLDIILTSEQRHLLQFQRKDKVLDPKD